MKLKSYFADTVEAAMEQAGRELGEDAMLVYSQQTSPDARHRGVYEVVFGLSSEGAPENRPVKLNSGGAPNCRVGPEAETPAGAGGIRKELAGLRNQVSRLAGAIVQNGFPWEYSGPLSEEYHSVGEELLRAGLSGEIAQEIVTRLRRNPDIEGLRPGPGAPGRIRDALHRELSSMLTVDSAVGSSQGGARVVAVAGPPGAGKTTALVKIAARHALSVGKPVQFLSMDLYRIGAAEQLRSFAAILGMGCQALDSTRALEHALKDHEPKDLLLIDTPGHGETDIDASLELAAFLRSHEEVDVHLTLPGSMKASDLRSTLDRYQSFRPTKILITKIDETESPGTVVSEAIRTALPISFLSAGQQIPEDLEPATIRNVMGMVLSEQFAQAAVPVIDPVDASRSERALAEATVGQAAAA